MNQKTPSHRLISIARIGEWAVSIALLLLFVLALVCIWWIITDPKAVSASLLEDFNLPDTTPPLSQWQLVVTGLLWSAADIVGVFFFLTARALFQGYRKGKVFTLRAATQLRTIGWLIVAVAPVRIFSEMLAILVASFNNPVGNRQVTLSLEDGDVYAIVIGLIIVTVSHVLIEAIRLKDENKAFV